MLLIFDERKGDRGRTVRIGTLVATTAVLAGAALGVAPEAHAAHCPPGTQDVPYNIETGFGGWCESPDGSKLGYISDFPQPGSQAQQPQPQTPPPHDAITVSFGAFSQGGGLPVTVANASSVPGNCTYDSTPFDFHQDFSVGANASTTFDIRGIPTATSYNVRVQCTGQFNGATVVIGQVNTTKQF
jgi:hypothetical protein